MSAYSITAFTDFCQALLVGFTGCMVAVILETAMIAEFVTGTRTSAVGQKVAIFAIFLYATVR